jgi:hypothetical protein
MKYALLVLLSVVVLHAREAAAPCDDGDDGLLKYQQQILQSVDHLTGSEDLWFRGVSHPLGCLLQTQEQGKGRTKYYAGSLLRPLIGGPVTEGLPQDSRYQKVSDLLLKMTVKSPDVINQSLLTLFAAGEWGFFSPCEGTGYKKCPIFLPEEKDIRNQSPIIAAASMLHLQKAYLNLEGKEKKEAKDRIMSLYLNTPENAPLQREVIKRIYLQLFSTSIPLSQS